MKRKKLAIVAMQDGVAVDVGDTIMIPGLGPWIVERPGTRHSPLALRRAKFPTPRPSPMVRAILKALGVRS